MMATLLAADTLTRSVEDYLKAIYQLSSRGHPATTSSIAQLLGLSAPSVTGMIKRLSELGLLEHVPYRGVQLTDAGRQAALRVVRRHRVLESYLVEFLGYTWDAVHEEAERLEHAASEVLIERMAAALGNPQFDPHGDPIPDSQGAVEEPVSTPLSDIPVGAVVELCRVQESQPDKLRYIASLGLKPGVKLSVVDHQPFDDLVTIDVGGQRHVLGRDLSHVLQCAAPGDYAVAFPSPSAARSADA